MNHFDFVPWINLILVLSLLAINLYTQRLLDRSNRLARRTVRSLMHSTAINSVLMDALTDIVRIGHPESVRRLNQAVLEIEELRRREAQHLVDEMASPEEGGDQS